LRRAGLEELAGPLEALPLEALYSDLEQLEQRLTAIEEKMIARLRSDAPEEALFEARRTLDRELKPYRGKMSAEQLSMLEKQFLERKLLENRGLPRLSLFYLHT
jgi:DNA repair exonuclease SbcCD ATPase subunit